MSDIGTTARVSRLLYGASPDPGIEALLPDAGNSWAISPDLGRFLAAAVRDFDCRRVLEFGAGSSSVVLATALSRQGGGVLTSVEQSPEWCADAWARVEQLPGVDARLIEARPRFTAGGAGFYHAFASAAPALAARGPYGLVLIDAPQWYFGRDGSLHVAYPSLAPGALVVLDDAGRSAERRTVRRWLRTYPGLELVHFDPRYGGRGIAVLRYSGNPAMRASARSWLTSGWDAAQNWRRRRRRGARA